MDMHGGKDLLFLNRNPDKHRFFAGKPGRFSIFCRFSMAADECSSYAGIFVFD